MAEWSATVSGKNYDLRLLTFTIAFDGVTWVDVWFRESLSWEAPAQASLQIKMDKQDMGPSLRIVATLDNGGVRVQPKALVKSDAPKKAFTLYQQVKGGTIRDFIGSICGGNSIGIENIRVDHLDQLAVSSALPKDTCVAMGNTLTHDARFSRLVDLLAARGVVVGGWIRTFGSEKNVRYVFVGEEAASTATLKAEEWCASGGRDAFGGSFRLTRNLAEGESASDIAEDLLNAEKLTVKHKDAFPIAPTWVQFGKDPGTAMFASRVTTELALNEADPTGSQGHTILELVDQSARSQRVTGFGNIMLLGKISAPANKGEMFVKVKPLTKQPAEFQTWKMPEDDMALSVYFAAPGYFQKDETTLYVPLRDGDIVVFLASEAGPPLAVGALGKGLGKEDESIRIWKEVTFHRNVNVEGKLEVK